MTTPWNRRQAQRMQGIGGSAIRELLKLTEKPDLISFAGGLPSPDAFPVEAFQLASARVLSTHGSKALQYSATDGFRPLREWIVDTMASYGIRAAPENVMITSGSQQALDIIGKILINPGDLVLTERPTYLGALQAWNAYQADFITVPIDDDGLQVDQLEEALCAGPKFMYILPNFQNPGGVTLSTERRQQLIEIADHYGIPIIEDDPYGELRYDGEHSPPLVVLDNQLLNSQPHHTGSSIHKKDGYLWGNVIYLSTFSKTLAPGLRLAWIVAPVDVVNRAILAKQGMDLHTSTFVQMMAYELLTGSEMGDAFFMNHVRSVRELYHKRRDAMLYSLEKYFPSEATWTRPQGGLFLWVTLPEGVDSAELLPQAIEHNVAYVPGSNFYPGPGGNNKLRLNFSFCDESTIEEGIQRLAVVINNALDLKAAVHNGQPAAAIVEPAF